MRTLLAAVIPLFLAVAAVWGSGRAEAASAPVYVVIVNPDNPSSSAERTFLEDAFLKKVTRWPNDEVIRPVDLPPKSAVRQRFSEEVLKRSVEAVKGYWQQRIFSGRDVPPPELDTDDEVVSYVLKFPGAVGYVSGTANLNGAKVLPVR